MSVPIVIMWPSLGPYHVARLEYAAGILSRSGFALCALETCERSSTYAWDVVPGAKLFRREQLFPQADYNRISFFRIWRGVQAKLDELNPVTTVVCGYAIADAWAAIHWSRRHGRSLVVLSDSNQHDASRVGPQEWVKRQIIKRCDAAVVAGSSARAYMQGLGMSSELIFDGCDVIDNGHFSKGVDVARQKDQTSTHARTPSFLTVCRFVPKKNLITLLYAYRQYRDQVGATAWLLVIAGDGPGRMELQSLVHTLDLRGCVEFSGFLQYDQLPATYARAAAFILPSLCEQWGLVVNEAMAAGLPVVVSQNAGCAADLVQNGVNGWTFDPQSVNELAGRMQCLHEMAWTQRQAMGAASQRIIAGWGLERFADGLLNATQAAVKHAAQR